MSFEHLITILIFNSFVVPKFVLLIIFTLLLKPLFIWAIKNLWPDGYEPFDVFKIKSHVLNWLFIILYFSFFVVLLFIFRLFRIGYEFDLKPFISFIKDIIEYKDYIFLFMLITGLLCISFSFIGIIKRIKNFFTIELLKRHIILQAKSSIKRKRKYYQLIIFLDMLKHCFAGLEYYGDYVESSIGTKGIYIHLQQVYNALFSRAIIARRLSSPFIFLSDLSDEFDFKKDFFQKMANRIINFWDFLLGIIFISMCNICIIAYDLFFNNFVLTKIFYFLPFYFIYLIWYKTIGFYLEKGATISGALCQILYNCYYNKDKVKYIFLTPEHHKIVAYFIRLGLIINDEISQCDVFSVSRMILYQCEYELENKDTHVYTNKYTKRSFIIREKDGKEEIIEIHPGNVTFSNY